MGPSETGSGRGRSRPVGALLALAVAVAFLLALVPGARADVLSGPYFDPQDDAGVDPAAVDLIINTAVHVEGNPTTSADDEIRLSSSIRAPGGQLLFARSADVLLWFLNTDGNAGTGDTVIAGSVGAERQIAVFDSPTEGPVGELRTWNGSAYETLRPLAQDELDIDPAEGDGSQPVSVEVPMADLGLARGAVATFAQRSEFGPASDRAPGVSAYDLTIPAAPAPSDVPTKPFVGTTSATGIRQTTITVSGQVNPGGLPTTFRFEYGQTTAYGLASPPQNVVLDPSTPGNPVALVSRFLSDLVPGTTYHYRLVATNSLGTSASIDRTFDTMDPRPPDVDDLLAANITQTSATLSAGIDPNGAVTTYFFEYGLEGASTPAQTPPGQTPSTAAAAGTIVTATVAGLQPGTAYRYALVASSAFGGPVRTPTLTFTTLPLLPPALDTTPASGVGQTAATLNGVVDPNGLPTTYRFEYGLTTSYELGSTPPGQTAAGDAPLPVSAGVSGLRPETIYHYRIVAESAAGTAASGDRTFITARPPDPPPPAASTGEGRATGPRAARLAGRITANGAAGAAYFEWGLAPTLGRRTSARQLAGDGTLDARLTGLVPNRRYAFRMVIETAAGRIEGEVLFFRTHRLPAIRARPEVPLACRLSARKCRLHRFTLGVQVVNPETDRPLVAPSAARGVRVRVSCTRGCSVTRSFRLRPGRLRLASISGRRVTIRVVRSGRGLRANLAPLFTDARGAPHVFRFGAEVEVLLVKPGFQSGGFKLRAVIGDKLRTCEVRGGDLIRCRPTG